jgi:hypothetical protein
MCKAGVSSSRRKYFVQQLIRGRLSRKAQSANLGFWHVYQKHWLWELLHLDCFLFALCYPFWNGWGCVTKILRLHWSVCLGMPIGATPVHCDTGIYASGFMLCDSKSHHDVCLHPGHIPSTPGIFFPETKSVAGHLGRTKLITVVNSTSLRCLASVTTHFGEFLLIGLMIIDPA